MSQEAEVVTEFHVNDREGGADCSARTPGS